MTAESLKIIQLTLVVHGDTLLALLTDDGPLFLVGETHDLGGRIKLLEDRWSEAGDETLRGIDSTVGSQALSGLQSFGSELFNTLLSDRIRSYFSQSPPCDLRLTIDARLCGLPWESVFDGRAHWQHFHVVSRRLWNRPVADSPPKIGPRAPLLNLLLLCEGGVASPAQAYAIDLRTFLESLPGVAVRLADLGRMSDIEPIDAVQADIVHVVRVATQAPLGLESKPELTRVLGAARLVVLDWADGDATGASWSRMGEEIALLLAGQAQLSVIQRPGPTHGTPRLALGFYHALARDTQLSESPGAYVSGCGVVSSYGVGARTLFPAGLDAAPDRSHRQITALSYDLVKSTLLIDSMGAERYSLKLLEYHRRFMAVVQRWGGLSDRPQGNDGVMNYFGVHHAREDTVRAALHAARELLDVAVSMQVELRVGVATGDVAVNPDHRVGQCVHLAAHIQKLAPTGTALTNAITYALAKSHFTWVEFVHPEDSKKVPRETSIYQLGAPKPQQDHDPAASNEPLSLYGRQPEMEQLEAEWALAGQGRARWLHVTGEAGIGKSRLVSVFAQRIQLQDEARTFVCRCFADSAGRAFGPIIDMLARWFGMRSTDDVATLQAKLAQGVANQGIAPHDHLAISYLMGLPTQDSRKPDLQIPLEPRRRLVMQTMVTWLINQARNRAICFLVEDVQWVDPSTLEYLQRLKAEGAGSAMLVLLTERTEHHQRGRNPLADESLALRRLDDRAVHAMIDTLATGVTLGQGQRDLIVGKTDGVPLFVEMSTRMVLENLEAAELPGGTARDGEYPIPVTLRDLLTQRLDNLGPARRLAQVCSAIGREFPGSLLLSLCDANVASLSRDRLQSHLAALLRSGLLLASGGAETADAQYHFRHALVHEAAYQSMWDIDRRSLHYAIAQAIELRVPEVAAAQPEVLARHYSACEAAELAAKWHWLAARRYKATEAHAESLNHLAIAKKLLEQLPATVPRLKSELDVELTMAGQLIATKGYGSIGAGRSYLAALALAQKLGDKKSMLRAQLGLEAYHLMRADFGQAHAYLSQAQHTAREFDDPLTRAQCLFALANVLHHQGHAQAMQENCDLCLQVCRQFAPKGKLVQSPEVMSLMYSSVCLWEMGQVDLARQRAQEGVDAAQRLGQRLGLGQALGMQAMVLMWCGELSEAECVSERAIGVCQSGDHDMWTAHARLIHGSCISEQGDPEKGLAWMDAAYELWTSTGTIVTRTFYLALMAPAHAALGRVDHALGLLDEACRIIKEHGERYYEAEVLRIRGELLIMQAANQGIDNTAAADAAFAEAQASAQALGYHSLGLRVATSIARRCLQRGRRAVGIQLLQNAISTLKDGYSTRDQRQARELLTELSR